MIRISRLADYALIIVSLMSQQPDDYVSVSSVAAASGLPIPTVGKILKMLIVSQLVESKKGAMGGYKLLKAIDKMSLLELVEAIDGKIAVTDCTKVRFDCELASQCQFKEGWNVINQVIVSTLQKLKIADMVNQSTAQAVFYNIH